MKKLLLVLALLLASPSAWAQCSGVFPNNTVCGNATGGSTTPRAISGASLEQMLLFTADGAGAVQRTVDSKLKDFVSIKDFGAVCNGVTDDLAAFNNALASHYNVYIPEGTCAINGTINITLTGNRLHGASRSGSVILATNNNAPAISIAPGLYYVDLDSFFVNRTGSPTSAAHGIVVSDQCSVCKIKNIVLQGHGGWGLKLGESSGGRIENVSAQGNLLGGVQLKNSSTTLLQWEMEYVAAIQNAGPGFSIESVAGTGDVTVGSYRNLISYGNSGRGIQFLGVNTAPIFGVRIFDSGFGSDAGSEVYLDTFARGHMLTSVSTELAGVSATGPTLSTPATHVGHGFEFTANNSQIQAVNLLGDNNSYNGLDSKASYVGIADSVFTNSGNALSAGKRSGMSFDVGTAIRVTGSKTGNIQGATSTEIGIAFGGFVTDAIASDNDLTSNTVAPISATATGKVAIYNNAGFNVNYLRYPLTANTSQDGILLAGSAAASSGNQQFSPRILLQGQGWKTNATAASQPVDWKIENQPVQGAASPDTNLVFGSQINAGGFNDRMTLLDHANISETELRLFSTSVDRIALYVSGTSQAVFYSSAGEIFFGSQTNIPLQFITNNAVRGFFKSGGELQLGSPDSATPTAVFMQAQSVVGGTSNTAGIDWTFNASRGTGTGAGGNLIWQVAPAAGAGSAQNTLIQAMVIDSLGHIRVGSNTAPALTGCGGGSPAITGDDTAGEVTMGTTATGCVITFNKAYANAPYCVLNWQATPLASQSWTVSTTAITTVQTSTSSNKLNYICRARNAG